MKTAITMPSSPSAKAKRASECCRCDMRLRNSSVLPCLLKPMAMYSSSMRLKGMIVRRKSIRSRGRGTSTRKYDQLNPNTTLARSCVEQRGVHHDAALRAEQGDHERKRHPSAPNAADQIGALVSVEDRAQHIDGRRALFVDVAQRGPDQPGHDSSVTPGSAYGTDHGIASRIERISAASTVVLEYVS